MSLGHHIFDVLAKEIHSVIEKFSLQDKVSTVVTDNGTNFVKAFMEFQKVDDEEHCESEKDNVEKNETADVCEFSTPEVM